MKKKLGVCLIVLCMILNSMNVFASPVISKENDSISEEEYDTNENPDFQNALPTQEMEQTSGKQTNEDFVDENQQISSEQSEDYVQESQGKEQDNEMIFNEVKVADFYVDEIKKNEIYKLVAKGIEIPGGIVSLNVAVWSEINGQDDLKWYKTGDDGQGMFSQEIRLNNHKGLGLYFVHIYGVNAKGESVYVDSTNFSTDKPQIEGNITTGIDGPNNSFLIKISDVKNKELIQKIELPTWNEKNNQADIRWYVAQETTEGNFETYIDISKHDYLYGRYVSHIYITDITGNRYYVGQTEASMELDKGSLEIENNQEEVHILVEGVGNAGIKNILIPVWSTVNGQDDIIWYTLKVKDGKCETDIKVKDHKHLGEFNLHVYAEMKNGAKVFLQKATTYVQEPEAGKIELRDVDREKGTFTVLVSGIKNVNKVKEIQVPIWTSNNQKDIKWYKGQKISDDSYKVEFNVRNHDYLTGSYNIHVYLTDITGTRKCIGTTTCNMTPAYDSINASSDEKEMTYVLNIKGLKFPGGEKKVWFAIWGEDGGQNDLRWYSARKEEKGNYIAQVKIQDHKEIGLYQVHVYCDTQQDGKEIIGTTQFEVHKNVQCGAVLTSGINGAAGTFKVTVTGLTAPAGVNKVEIPIWSSVNQSDAYWYTAVKESEGIYSVNVNVKNHKYNFGDYNIHVYTTVGNGTRSFVGKALATIQPSNYVYSTSIDEYKREIVIKGVPVNTSEVQFPTWSETYGQDDVVWYRGTNLGNGTWKTIVDGVNHKSSGEYITHVYATIDSQKVMLNSISYNLKWRSNEISLMTAKANLYGSNTPYIILVNRSTHKVGVFQGWAGNWNCIRYWECSDGKASTPTVMGVFKVGSRGYYFDSGDARCFWWTQFYGDYLFHSVLYNRNGTLQDGRLGMALSHGCVRLQIDNAKWIYDTIPSSTTVVVY